MGKAVIKVSGLKKSFGSHVVHRDISFEVFDNEIFVVMGPSGVGKSVLLKQVVGLIKPDGGSIEVYGKDILRLSGDELIDFRETVTYVFQGGALFDSLNVWQNVAFFLLERKGVNEGEARERASYFLSLVGLKGTEELYPSELSGGMKKRVALARALCINPRCIMFDEPTSGLDPVMTAIIERLILRLRREMGKTCVVVSHDVQSAFRIADRIAILWDGRIVEVGTPEEIRSSENPVVKQFIEGKPEGPITASAGYRG